MNSFSQCILAILFLQHWAVNSSAEETIRLSTGDWYPYMSEELEHYGVALRIVTESFSLVGVKVEYGFYPWKRSITLAKEGDWDGAALWSHKPEREQHFLYSTKPIIAYGYVFYHLKSYDFDWKSYDDLKGIRIGGTIEYHYGNEFFNAVKEKGLSVQYVPKDEMNFSKLLKGRVQIVANDPLVGYAMIHKTFPPETAAEFTHHSKPIKESGLHLLIRKKHKESKGLLRLFNKGHQMLISSGKVDEYVNEFMKGVSDYKN